MKRIVTHRYILLLINLLPLTRIVTGHNIVTSYLLVTIIVNRYSYNESLRVYYSCK